MDPAAVSKCSFDDLHSQFFLFLMGLVIVLFLVIPALRKKPTVYSWPVSASLSGLLGVLFWLGIIERLGNDLEKLYELSPSNLLDVLGLGVSFIGMFVFFWVRWALIFNMKGEDFWNCFQKVRDSSSVSLEEVPGKAPKAGTFKEYQIISGGPRVKIWEKAGEVLPLFIIGLGMKGRREKGVLFLNLLLDQIKRGEAKPLVPMGVLGVFLAGIVFLLSLLPYIGECTRGA